MAKNRQYPTTPDSKVEIKQVFTTSGNIATPVEGLSSDAGLGKPPVPGCYGQADTGSIPSGEKMPSGTGRAMKAYFKGHGGGKP